MLRLSSAAVCGSVLLQILLPSLRSRLVGLGDRRRIGDRLLRILLLDREAGLCIAGGGRCTRIGRPYGLRRIYPGG